jgi:hypothetical protein
LFFFRNGIGVFGTLSSCGLAFSLQFLAGLTADELAARDENPTLQQADYKKAQQNEPDGAHCLLAQGVDRRNVAQAGTNDEGQRNCEAETINDVGQLFQTP